MIHRKIFCKSGPSIAIHRKDTVYCKAVERFVVRVPDGMLGTPVSPAKTAQPIAWAKGTM